MIFSHLSFAQLEPQQFSRFRCIFQQGLRWSFPQSQFSTLICQLERKLFFKLQLRLFFTLESLRFFISELTLSFKLLLLSHKGHEQSSQFRRNLNEVLQMHLHFSPLKLFSQQAPLQFSVPQRFSQPPQSCLQEPQWFSPLWREPQRSYRCTLTSQQSSQSQWAFIFVGIPKPQLLCLSFQLRWSFPQAPQQSEPLPQFSPLQ